MPDNLDRSLYCNGWAARACVCVSGGGGGTVGGEAYCATASGKTSGISIHFLLFKGISL